MGGRLLRDLGGFSGARAVAAAAAILLTAAATALGATLGAPKSLRLALGILALLAAIAVVLLTYAEHSKPARLARRRLRGAVVQHFSPRGRRDDAQQRERRPLLRPDRGASRARRMDCSGSALVATARAEEIGRRDLHVVTGDPGSGKSAVLGRLVAMSEPEQRRELKRDARGTTLPVNSIHAAVHAKDLSFAEVLEAIASALGVQAQTVDELDLALDL